MSTKVTENKGEKWLCSPTQICDLFGHSLTTFKKRCALPDFPENCRVSHGKYNLKIYLQWAVERFNHSSVQEAIAAEKLRKLTAEANDKELNVQERLKTFLSREQVISDLKFTFISFRQALLSWQKSLPPHLEGQDQKQIGLILRREVYSILTDLSQGLDAIVPKKSRKRGKKQ